MFHKLSMVTTNKSKGKGKAGVTKATAGLRTNPIVTPPVSPKKKVLLKKRVVIDYSKRESNESQIFTPKVNKTDSGIVIITFADKKKKYTYMEDMEKKQFLQENNMNFAKNFKVRDVSGKVKDQMQTIGQTGKSSRFATCFVHIIPDEEEYNKDEELYLNTLLTNLVASLNKRVSERITQYESICFKLPTVPIVETLTHEVLPNFFSREDCLQLFCFLYSKDIVEYSDTEQLFVDFPHITEEFIGANTDKNRKTLRSAHQTGI